MTTSSSLNALGHPALQPKTPVPSDIQVSMDIVKDIGLLSMEELAEQYVALSILNYELLSLYIYTATHLLQIPKQTESDWLQTKLFHGAFPKRKYP